MLWVAHRLLMRGWEVSEHESLGMSTVTDNRTSLYKRCPAPLVVENQGDQKLEQYIANLEVPVLKELQNAMRGTVRKSWVVVFTAVLILLLIRERDIWRLLYWIRNPQEVSTFIFCIGFYLTVLSVISGDIQSQQ